MHDGPDINVWDGLAIVVWLLAAGLLVADLFTDHGDGLGALTPFGGLAALAASVLTSAGIARRAKEEILARMDDVFKAGQDSVRNIRP